MSPLPLVLSLDTTERSLALSSFHPCFRHLYTLIKFTQSLLFTRLKSPKSLSFFSEERCSRPLITLVALHWTLSSIPMFLLYWEAWNRSQHSTCSLSSAEQKGRISPLELLAILFLTQPRMLLAFFTSKMHRWLTVSSWQLSKSKQVNCTEVLGIKYHLNGSLEPVFPSSFFRQTSQMCPKLTIFIEVVVASQGETCNLLQRTVWLVSL